MNIHNIAAATMAAALMSIVPASAQAQTKYFARSVLSTTTASASSPPVAKKTCAPGNHDAWTYMKEPNTPNGDYRNSTRFTKVGSGQDGSPALQTICAAAIAGSSRTQCGVVGQGGLNVDVYITQQDVVLPVETIDRDNAIVYEVLVCS